jgi:hypothetical protein
LGTGNVKKIIFPTLTRPGRLAVNFNTLKINASDAVTHFPTDFVAVELGRLGFYVNQAAEIAPFPADLLGLRGIRA